MVKRTFETRAQDSRAVTDRIQWDFRANEQDSTVSTSALTNERRCAAIASSHETPARQQPALSDMQELTKTWPGPKRVQ